jgi:hypothetical protein
MLAPTATKNPRRLSLSTIRGRLEQKASSHQRETTTNIITEGQNWTRLYLRIEYAIYAIQRSTVELYRVNLPLPTNLEILSSMVSTGVIPVSHVEITSRTYQVVRHGGSV